MEREGSLGWRTETCPAKASRSLERRKSASMRKSYASEGLWRPLLQSNGT